MSVALRHNQYGKAETRVVRVYRDSDQHGIVDYNVSVALSGDFADIHFEVFHADDRPYGFIEGTVHNDDAPAPGLAFDPGQGW